MKKSKGKTMSWGWVIFWLIIFWPVGIFLLIRKIYGEKATTLEKGKMKITISYVLIGIGVIYLLMTFTEDRSDMIIAAILFGGGGAWLNHSGRKMKLIGERYNNYSAIILNQYQVSIDYIASAIGLPYETVEQDLQKMISFGYFSDAYIDVADKSIVLHKSEESQFAEQESSVTIPVQVITCDSCCANNKVTGQFGECEYCGSPLWIFHQE